MTLAEILVVPVRSGSVGRVQEALHDLEVRELALPADTAVRLAQLRVSTGMKMPDCCVLLAAEQTSATVASFDERLAVAAARRDLHVLGPC